MHHHFNPWYGTEEGQSFLNATNGGQLMFVWEASMRDGSVVRMYEDLAFERALKDPTYVPPEDTRRSVDILDREKVVRFELYPIALTKKVHPHLVPFGVTVDPDNGDRFVSHWLTDHVPKSGISLRRTVIGFERLNPKVGEDRFNLTVVCPSGKVVMTHTEDMSYEGE